MKKSKIFFMCASIFLVAYFFASLSYGFNVLYAGTKPTENWEVYTGSVNSLTKDADTDGYYDISTPEQLAYWSKKYSNYTQHSFELTNDIDMGKYIFTPIALFLGEFDGNGFKIRNLWITGTSIDLSILQIGPQNVQYCTGLFAYTTGAKIRNVILENPSIVKLSEKSSFLVGYADGNTKISNCRIIGNDSTNLIDASGTDQQNLYFGSFAGMSYYATLERLFFDCSKTLQLLKDNVTVKNIIYLGGIVGLMQNSKLSLSGNESEIIVYGGNKAYVGGIAGCIANANGSVNLDSIEKSFNSKSLYASAKELVAIGGIVGNVGNSIGNNYYNIEDCYNTGTINSATQNGTENNANYKTEQTFYSESFGFLSLKKEIVQYNWMTKSTIYHNNFRGGIIGKCEQKDSVSISTCYNAGNIIPDDSTNIVEYSSCGQHTISSTSNNIFQSVRITDKTYDNFIGDDCGSQRYWCVYYETEIDKTTEVSYRYRDGNWVDMDTRESTPSSLNDGKLSDVYFVINKPIIDDPDDINNYNSDKYKLIWEVRYKDSSGETKTHEYHKIENLLLYDHNINIGLMGIEGILSNGYSSIWAKDNKINNGKPYLKDMYWKNSTTSPVYASFEFTTSSLSDVARVKSVTLNGLDCVEIPKTIINNEKTYQVTGISKGAFNNLTNLNKVIIPNSIIIIEEAAFAGCSNLFEVKFESDSKLSTINKEAFKGCSSLKTISLPKSIASIGEGVFNGCSNLEEITIPFIGKDKYNINQSNGRQFGHIFGKDIYNKSYEASQLWYWDTKTSTGGISKYYLPISLKKVTVLGGYGDSRDGIILPLWAFENCKFIETIVLPNNTKTLSEKSFYNCVNLRSVNVDSVTGIHFLAFWNCSSLQKILLSGNLQDVRYSAFLGLSSGTIIYYNNTVERWDEINPENYAQVPTGIKVICTNRTKKY